jgi:hypothetical protein
MSSCRDQTTDAKEVVGPVVGLVAKWIEATMEVKQQRQQQQQQQKQVLLELSGCCR